MIVHFVIDKKGGTMFQLLTNLGVGLKPVCATGKEQMQWG